MIFYFIRHGQTEYNNRWLMQGWSDIPLNETGIAQAEKAAGYFRKNGITFDRVYASPLCRAVKTACVVSGLSPEQVVTDERAKEIRLGIVEGQDFRQLPQIYKDLFDNPPAYVTPEGGESIAQVQARTRSLLEALKGLETADNDQETVLIATHGCALRAFLSVIEDTPLQDFWRPGLRNCCIVKVLLKKGIYTIDEIIESEDQ